MVRRGLARSRRQAQTVIGAYRVQVNGSFATKASRLVDPGDSIEVVGDAPRFVGRGGEKLEAALEAFGLDVEGLRCVDAGASTGGFTDCLLQRGAAEVVAIDVGYGQLHERLVADHRVHGLERTNIRDVSAADVGGPVDLVVADLSFISLCTVMASLVGLCSGGADLVVLVKPQFEAGREEAGRGRGVIRDPFVWRRVLEEVRICAASEGAALQACIVSPIRGGHGNVEFLFHLRLGSEPRAVDLDEVVASVGAA